MGVRGKLHQRGKQKAAKLLRCGQLTRTPGTLAEGSGVATGWQPATQELYKSSYTRACVPHDLESCDFATTPTGPTSLRTVHGSHGLVRR